MRLPCIASAGDPLRTHLPRGPRNQDPFNRRELTLVTDQKNQGPSPCIYVVNTRVLTCASAMVLWAYTNGVMPLGIDSQVLELSGRLLSAQPPMGGCWAEEGCTQGGR